MTDVPGWTNRRIEREGGAAYLEAQSKLREQQEQEAAKQREADDLERFTEAFVANGGNRSDAAAAFKALKNERAADASSQPTTGSSWSCCAGGPSRCATKRSARWYCSGN